MPSTRRLSAFIAAVVDGHFVEALHEYYHHDAVTRENMGPERRGLPTLVAIEERVLRTFQMRTHPPSRVVHDGDNVAIRWTFDMTDRAGLTRRMEEVALQRWQGERIAEEEFFFDPAFPVIASDGTN